jgi:hypothetical protein
MGIIQKKTKKELDYTLTIRFPTAEIEELVKESNKKHTSVAEIVRAAVRGRKK